MGMQGFDIYDNWKKLGKKTAFLRGHNSATTYRIDMATSDAEPSSFILPELLYFDNFPVVMGMENAFSDFSDNTYGDMVSLCLAW